MADLIDILKYFDLYHHIPLIDVRSPSEYHHGHIPGSLNIPLFDDQERAKIGTTYKNEGNYPALLEGLDIVGPKMSSLVKTAKELSQKKELVLHCWRGGMRSSSMAWLLETAGFDCKIIRGGYKSYRTSVKDLSSQAFQIIILGGLTGSGKSEILRVLKEQGQQVIDLEKLANHKGSAFGALGLGTQPSTEQFENNLYEETRLMDRNQPVWIEDESKTIGSVHIPDEIYKQMREARLIKIEVPEGERVKRLITEYSMFPTEKLLDSLERIRKRFGNQNIQPAKDAISNRDFEKAVRLILEYYDRTYLYGLSKRKPSAITTVILEKIEPETNAASILRHMVIH
jgi:tRNA 2-selenouridine synthase